MTAERRVLSHSAVSCMRRCNRKYFFKYVERREPLIDSEPLRFGRMFGDARSALITEDLPAAYKVIDVSGGEDDEMLRTKARALIVGYAERWDSLPEVIGTEVFFQMPLVNPETGRESRTWEVCGYLDSLMVGGGGVLVDELKTTSDDISPGSTYWQMLRLDPQIALYQVAAKHLGHDVRGISYDIARKPQLRPKKATAELKYNKGGSLRKGQQTEDETPQEFEQRNIMALAQDPEKYYQRNALLRDKDEEDDAMADLWQTAKNIRQAELCGRWPRNPGSCRFYNSFCEYFDVCTGCASLDDSMRFRDKEVRT